MGKAKEIARLAVAVCLGVLAAALIVWSASSLLGRGEKVEPTEAQYLYARWHDFQASAVTDTNGSPLGASGLSMLGIEVAGITTATVEFEGTIIGSTYYDLYAMNVESRAWVTSTTSDGYFALPLLGSSQVRCPITGYSGGTINVKGDASPVGAMDPGAVSAVLAAATDPTYIGDINFGESLPAGTNNIGDMDIASIAAGETHIGEVGAKSEVISVTLTLAASTYADGDVLADTQAITDAMRVNAGTGIPYSVVVIDLDDQAQALDILFLDTNCSIGTEDSAVSIADSCADDILCVVEIASGDYVDLANSQVAMGAPACVVESTAGIDELWFAVVSRGTGTYTASGIVLKLGFLLD